jgi:hypothetical protein
MGEKEKVWERGSEGEEEVIGSHWRWKRGTRSVGEKEVMVLKVRNKKP